MKFLIFYCTLLICSAINPEFLTPLFENINGNSWGVVVFSWIGLAFFNYWLLFAPIEIKLKEKK